ncbi:MAG TPA: hypothetical protein VJ739_08895 [Gemmataceae bacterium]|nr:hypothetical protein [Gemmataceae bacterium]
MALILAATQLAADLGGRPPFPRADGRLEGTWVIESVRRDGEPDPAQVGGTVTFASRSVTFRPRAGGVTVLNSQRTAAQPDPALFS